jgi:outer membrane protein
LTEPARFEPVTAVLARLGVAAQGGAHSDPPPADALPQLLRLAEQRRPELAAARERLGGGHAGVRAARGLYQPQVAAGAMADLMQTRDRDFLGGATFGVVASLPVLDGGLRRSQVHAAEAERERLEQETAKLTLQVHQEATNAWLALQAAAQNVQTAEAGLRSAQEDYRVTQVRYEAGKGINLELLDAVAARTRAETNRAQALYEYGVAQEQLQRAVGSGLPAAAPSPQPGMAPR